MYDLYMPKVFFSGHSKRLVCMTCIYPKYFQWSWQEASMYDLCAPSNFSSHSKRLVGMTCIYPKYFSVKRLVCMTCMSPSICSGHSKKLVCTVYDPSIFCGHSKRLVCMTCICPKYWQWSQQEAGMYDLFMPKYFQWSQQEVSVYDLYLPRSQK